MSPVVDALEKPERVQRNGVVRAWMVLEKVLTHLYSLPCTHAQHTRIALVDEQRLSDSQL